MVFAKLTFTPQGHVAPLAVPPTEAADSSPQPLFDAHHLVGQWIIEKSRSSRFADAGSDDLLPVTVPRVRRRR